MATTRSQLTKIVSFLESGKKLTKAEALRRFRVQNLSARISELRNDGVRIFTGYRKVNGKTVTQYVLGDSSR